MSKDKNKKKKISYPNMTSVQKKTIHLTSLHNVLLKQKKLQLFPCTVNILVSKCVTNNGDPLIANKKAYEAAKLTSALLAEAPSKNTSKACIL